MRSPWLLFTAPLNIFIKAAGVRSALSAGYRRRLSALSPRGQLILSAFVIHFFLYGLFSPLLTMRNIPENELDLSAFYLTGLLNCRRDAPLSAFNAPLLLQR